eukprot:9474508-Pyramimonas_sp.AAC.2
MDQPRFCQGEAQRVAFGDGHGRIRPPERHFRCQFRASWVWQADEAQRCRRAGAIHTRLVQGLRGSLRRGAGPRFQ